MDKLTEISEKYLIWIVGAKDRPMPSNVHLQKEMFILSQYNPKIQSLFHFEKHYKGPYSQLITNILGAPSFFPKAFSCKWPKISLTKEGRDELTKIIDEISGSPKFSDNKLAIDLIRDVYDRLTEDELMFLIYVTYPGYTEFSEVSDDLLKNEKKRNSLLESLISKGVISEERFIELKEKNYE